MCVLFDEEISIQNGESKGWQLVERVAGVQPIASCFMLLHNMFKVTILISEIFFEIRVWDNLTNWQSPMNRSARLNGHGINITHGPWKMYEDVLLRSLGSDYMCRAEVANIYRYTNMYY